VWKVLEFIVEIFKALKSLQKIIIGLEKAGKILENCNAGRWPGKCRCL